MAMVIVPITNDPNQTFSVSIPFTDRNVELRFFVAWNEIAGYWFMNIANDRTGEILVEGIPMMSGKAPADNLLEQYEYLKIGKVYILKSSSVVRDIPILGDWGVNFFLGWDE